jgi:hypothetical protein
MFFFLIAVLAGCSSSLSPVEKLDTIFVDDPTCVSPCWQGITPGESTEADFLALVESLPANKFDSLKQNELIPNGTQYIWYDRTTSFANEIIVQDDRIIFVSFQNRRDFNLDMILDYLGQPDSYTAGVYPGEAYMLVLNIIYETKGVVVTIRQVPFDAPSSAFPPECLLDAVPELPVWYINLIESSLSGEIDLGLSRVDIIRAESNPWPGLGTINLTDC